MKVTEITDSKLSKSHGKFTGFDKSHRKYRPSFDLVDFSKSHGKDSTKVTENAFDLAQVMELLT